MRVINLAGIAQGQDHLVGGKAAGLAEMIRAGERVPEGFCVTTDASREGLTDPVRQEIVDAYERLGGGPVAVRSSATAEDLPDASFAGQQDTFLNVTGRAELLEAIRGCWDSLDTERAVAYRAAGRIDEAAMAVVVQRMIEPSVAGVLFTANPITGRRTEMVVDAAPGLGTVVVDGTAEADHYVLGGEELTQNAGGCLDRAQLKELREAGERLQERRGAPQDVEWAIDREGLLWLLQSRPITTLFPAPPATDKPAPRAYLELGGHFQGVLRPFTPMGMSMVRKMAAGAGGSEGGVVEIGGRPFADLTDTLRDPKAREWLPKILGADFGPPGQSRDRTGDGGSAVRTGSRTTPPPEARRCPAVEGRSARRVRDRPGARTT